MTCAGEKKWVPTTASGREVAPAMASTSRVEVLVQSRAPGRQCSSSMRNTAFFTSIFS
eukprot:CAMPEP_0185774986 /NCGR_PEP_ID=MMETSP1174-20130828/80718_1 /TAXON_ID=35687 /ORGANISM="Dictyocha speculum, Strain CCMP1381" /LENGTH=57 /DNA_ID=CAMNT_0028462411 /DNA_START=145 /DNA_END=314 /DNA_ORIENTATION=+